MARVLQFPKPFITETGAKTLILLLTTQVLQISGGVGILGVHILFLVGLLPFLPPASTTPNAPSEEESKSLWHVMAQSMLAVDGVDRDRFLDLCLKRRVLCEPARFDGPEADFKWSSSATVANKNRFWHAYTCVYNSNLTQCPVDGEWSPWSPWNHCDATCDATGNQTRTRTCSNPVPVRGGDRCHGSTMRSRPCLGQCRGSSERGGLEGAEAFLKQVHEAYPSLMHDCYNAHCTYGVVQKVINEKHVRAKYWSTLSCVKYGGACPVDGKWGPWGVWSQCSMKCGSGSRTRSRTCDSPQPAFAGHPCKGEFHEQQSCIMRDCGLASTETFTEWTKWTPCSVSCGGYGVQKATRVCLRHAGCDLLGVMTPYVNRSRPCYTGDCPVQGGWSDWSDWTDCSAACGVGRQCRVRMCDSPFPAGGLDCIGNGVDFRLCKGQNCAGQPSPPEIAHREKSDPGDEAMASKGDEYLNGPLNPSLESLYTPWSPWTRCSASCGQGLRVRKRWCSANTTPIPPCEGEVRQIQFCNVFVCPVLGSWSVWLPWTPCSKTCGVGKRQRYRECSNPLPQFGGSCLGDSMRVDDCEIGPCPRISSGTWSTWSPWTQCSVSCGGGQRGRQRNRQRYAGSSKSLILDSKEAEQGSKETLDCNTQPCPVDGSWAEWGEWTRCSAPCGLGRRIRDRTCTDPSPVFGGHVCPGPGTDLAQCFAGPCKDTEDRAVYLGTTSWIRFGPHNRPTRFLAIYLHFKPMAPAGSVLRRYRQCRSVFDDDDDKENEKEKLDDSEDKENNDEDKKADEDDKCQLVVDVRLQQAEVKIAVLARGAQLAIHSRVGLSLGSWHEILVEVLKSGASLRVNNHERLFSNFSRPLHKDLDFDSYMVLGANDNKTVGMIGSISSLSINFLPQDLFSSTDWQGQGTPVGRHAISVQSINPSVQLPHFQGLLYSPIRLFHRERLSVRLTMALDAGEGLLLYCPGEAEGTFMTLGFKQSRFVLCMACNKRGRHLCHRGDLLRLHQWYHVTLLMEDTEAELRVDQGKALQLTCKGLPFKPRKILFVGGRSAAVWGEVQKVTNYTDGFFGVLGTLVVNGRTLSFRRAVLMGRDDRINPDGYSRTLRITPVFEHKSSIVMLHCEVQPPDDPSTEVKVVWLLRDTVLEPSEYVEIVKPVGLVKRVGTLHLKPGGHNEGIYACVISRDGRLQLNHIFPVFRHPPRQDLDEGRMEWVFLKLLLILLPLLAVCFIVYKFRHWFIKLWNKLFGRKGPEKEPLLPTEPMDVWRPDQPHLQGQDGQGSWDNYLVQPQGTAQKEEVVSFGEPQQRRLSATPGVYTDRALHVSTFGQIKLGDDPRPTSELLYGGEEANEAAHGSSPKEEEPAFANLTYNRPCMMVTCRQQQPIRPQSHNEYVLSRRSRSGDLGASVMDQAHSSKGARSYSVKARKLSKGCQRSHGRADEEEDASFNAGHRRSKTARKRSYGGDSRRLEEAEKRDKHSKGIPTSLNRHETRVRAPSTHPTNRTTSYKKRSRSEDRSHQVPRSHGFPPASPPPFGLRQYQLLRVRVPEPVVYSRNEQTGAGSSAKHHVYQIRRNSERGRDGDDVSSRRHRYQRKGSRRHQLSPVSSEW